MKKLITVLVIIALLLVVFLLLGPFYILNEGEQAVVTRFGKIVDTQTESGLKFKMPLVDNVVKYSSKLQSWDGEAQRIPTTGLGRLNDIIDSTIRTVISENNLNEAVRSTNQINEINVVEDFQDVDSAEDAQTLQTLTATTTVQQSIEIGREGISNMILEQASAFTDTYGIALEDVIIRQIRYSDDLTESVYERMIKERNQIAEAYRSYGRGQLAEWQGTTERDMNTILSEAEAEAARIRGEADAEASRIYSESYSADPEFFEFYSTMQSYRNTIPSMNKILSTDSEYFKYI